MIRRCKFNCNELARVGATTSKAGGLKTAATNSKAHCSLTRSFRSRPADAPRPSCTSDGKSELHTRLQQLSREAGLGATVRINKSGCLDQCEHGPTVVVYPDAVWYGNVRPEDAEEIVREHLVGGRPVERLRIADAGRNAKSCPHKAGT